MSGVVFRRRPDGLYNATFTVNYLPVRDAAATQVLDVAPLARHSAVIRQLLSVQPRQFEIVSDDRRFRLTLEQLGVCPTAGDGLLDPLPNILSELFDPLVLKRFFLLCSNPDCFNRIEVESSPEPAALVATAPRVLKELDDFRTQLVQTHALSLTGSEASRAFRGLHSQLLSMKDDVVLAASKSGDCAMADVVSCGLLDLDVSALADPCGSLAGHIVTLTRLRTAIQSVYMNAQEVADGTVVNSPSRHKREPAQDSTPSKDSVASGDTRTGVARLSVVHAPALLLLCEVLDASELRAVCLQCIISRYQRFSRHPKSPAVVKFLPPTALREILLALPSSVLPFKSRGELSVTDASFLTPGRHLDAASDAPSFVEAVEELTSVSRDVTGSPVTGDPLTAGLSTSWRSSAAGDLSFLAKLPGYTPDPPVRLHSKLVPSTKVEENPVVAPARADTKVTHGSRTQPGKVVPPSVPSRQLREPAHTSTHHTAPSTAHAAPDLEEHGGESPVRTTDADYVAEGYRLSLRRAQERQAAARSAAEQREYEQQQRKARLQELEEFRKRQLHAAAVKRASQIPHEEQEESEAWQADDDVEYGDEAEVAEAEAALDEKAVPVSPSPSAAALYARHLARLRVLAVSKHRAQVSEEEKMKAQQRQEERARRNEQRVREGVMRARSRSRDAKMALQRQAGEKQAEVQARKQQLLEARDHRLQQFVERRVSASGPMRTSVEPAAPPAPPGKENTTHNAGPAGIDPSKLHILRQRMQSKRTTAT